MPENTETNHCFNRAKEQITLIRGLTEQIATNKKAKSDVESLNQAVMKRGELIQELCVFLSSENMDSLEQAQKEALFQAVEAIQIMDKPITQELQAGLKKLSFQLLNLKEGKKTLQGYHLQLEESASSTRSQDA